MRYIMEPVQDVKHCILQQNGMLSSDFFLAFTSAHLASYGVLYTHINQISINHNIHTFKYVIYYTYHDN